MNETLKEAHIQNVAQERATLAIEGAPFLLDNGQLAIRIKNNGHLPAQIPKYEVMYIQRDLFGKSFERFRQAEPNSSIAAGDAYNIAISLPPIPSYRINPKTKLPIIGQYVWDLRLNLQVSYDDGFGNKATLDSCFTYDPSTHIWGATCMSVNSIDLSNASPQIPDMPIK